MRTIKWQKTDSTAGVFVFFFLTPLNTVANSDLPQGGNVHQMLATALMGSMELLLKSSSQMTYLATANDEMSHVVVKTTISFVQFNVKFDQILSKSLKDFFKCFYGLLKWILETFQLVCQISIDLTLGIWIKMRFNKAMTKGQCMWWFFKWLLTANKTTLQSRDVLRSHPTVESSSSRGHPDQLSSLIAEDRVFLS